MEIEVQPEEPVSRKASTKKDIVMRPPTKGKDLSLLMKHKKLNPDNTQNSS